MLKTSQQIFKTYEKELKAFQEWIEENPRLPQNIGEIKTKFNFMHTKNWFFAIPDKLLLIRYLKIYDFDLEKAKKLLVINLEMRKKNSAIFEKRDILSDELQQAIQMYKIYVLPVNSPENHKISIFRMIEDDPNKFSVLECLRIALCVMDARFVSVDNNELIDGDLMIHDMKGLGFKHLMKMIANLSLLRNYSRYCQESVPLKLVQNHFVNCSAALPKVMNFIKPLLNKQVSESTVFHSNLDSLYEYIPRKFLPTYLGGTVGDDGEIFDDWMKKEFLTKR